MKVKKIVNNCIEKEDSQEEIGACVVGEVRKQQALESLENAVQAIGKWSEETDEKMVRRLVPDYVEKIDKIGNEIKEL